MGETKGFVTRAFGGGMFSTGGESASFAQRGEWKAHKKDGSEVGFFGSVSEAQAAVGRSLGGRMLKWTRDDIPGGIESYRGESTDFFPGDLGGQLEGGIWWRADQGVVKAPEAPPSTLEDVRRWTSLDGSTPARGATATAALAPSFSEVALAGRPALRFVPSAARIMATTGAGFGPPHTVFAAATRGIATHGRDEEIVQSGNWALRVNTAGMWQVQVAAATITGAAAGEGAPGLLSAIMGAASTQAFLNGVSIGSAAAVPDGGNITISDLANWWGGYLSEILIVPGSMNLTQHAIIANYFLREYNLP